MKQLNFTPARPISVYCASASIDRTYTTHIVDCRPNGGRQDATAG